ncbi:MAG: hypothetical protein C4290_10205 [Chloroflexota bacterium]
MKYAAMIEYIADPDKVQSVRPVHREYLAKLKEQGRLVASGPFADGSGALIIYEADSPEQAEALLKADPFYQAGVFLSWRIRPWNQVF